MRVSPQRRLARVSGTLLGNRRHTAAKAETTGYARAFRRAADSQPNQLAAQQREQASYQHYAQPKEARTRIRRAQGLATNRQLLRSADFCQPTAGRKLGCQSTREGPASAGFAGGPQSVAESAGDPVQIATEDYKQGAIRITAHVDGK